MIIHPGVSSGALVQGLPAIFRTGYILNGRADAFWFIALPFLAIAIALGCQHWLTAVAVASAGLWLTLPHHYATWVRTYALEDEWTYYRARLLAGPLVIAAMTFAGLYYAPLTLLLVIAMWDHQHSLMQQHGFARIYDYKARTGAPSTPKFDLALNWFLYVNLFLTTPFFTTFWVRELYRFHFEISRDAVYAIQMVSYTATGIFLCVYLVHILWCLKRGYQLNPVKYLFIGSSYFLWYFTAWSIHDLLIYGVAHKIMHGLQYIVIVQWYLWNKTERSGGKLEENALTTLLKPGNITVFVIMALIYAVIFQLITSQPISEFGFGVPGLLKTYDKPIEAFGMGALSPEAGFSLYAGLLVYSTQLLHYYLDSFIWKVRDRKVQAAL